VAGTVADATNRCIMAIMATVTASITYPLSCKCNIRRNLHTHVEIMSSERIFPRVINYQPTAGNALEDLSHNKKFWE
jgi:hypothetical protein